MSRPRAAILAITAGLVLAACGPEPRGSAPGPASPVAATPATGSRSQLATATPDIVVLRHGEGFRITVSLAVAHSAELWVARVRLLDSGGRELGAVDLARPGPDAVALPATAHFDVASEPDAVTVVITDSAGHTWQHEEDLS